MMALPERSSRSTVLIFGQFSARDWAKMVHLFFHFSDVTGENTIAPAMRASTSFFPIQQKTAGKARRLQTSL
jgi:hypothetical protein